MLDRIAVIAAYLFGAIVVGLLITVVVVTWWKGTLVILCIGGFAILVGRGMDVVEDRYLEWSNRRFNAKRARRIAEEEGAE